MSNKQGYKKTDLGELPFEWKTKRIEDICEILDSKRVPLNKEQRDNMKGCIPYYGANGVVDYINDYLFDEDLILMAEDGGYFDEYRTRHIAYKVKGKSWVNNHAHVLKVLDSQTYDFIYYTLVHKNILPFINGGTRAKLNQADLKKILIQYPPLKEQQKIAEILSSVDAAIEKIGQVIAKTEEVKKGLMQQLLTKGIGHTEFVDTELGSLPSTWAVMNFMNLVNILDFRGKTPKKLGLDWGGNIPALSANNVRMGYIDFSLPTHYGNDELYTKWMTKGDLEIGDLVLTTEAPAGNVAIINKNERYILSQRVIGIKIHRDYLLPEYLKYYFMSDLFNKYLKQFSTGTTVTGISQKSLAFLNIPVPSLEEQEKISSILVQYDLKLSNDNLYLKELKNLKSGLMQQLLTGQVRVKVD